MNIGPNEQLLRQARRAVLRSALRWLPLFVVFSAGAVFFFVRAVTDDAGAWVGFAILGLIALLSLPLLVAALQDLRADPVETEGTLARKWTKADFFLFRGYYFMIGRRVFRVDKSTWLAMPDASARVHLLHYPHTSTLIDWQSAGESSADGDDAPTLAARDWRPVPATPPTVAEPGARPVAPAVEPPRFGEAFRPLPAPDAPPDTAAEKPPGSRREPRPEAPPGRVEPPRFGAPRETEPRKPDQGGGA